MSAGIASVTAGVGYQFNPAWGAIVCGSLLIASTVLALLLAR